MSGAVVTWTVELMEKRSGCANSVERVAGIRNLPFALDLSRLVQTYGSGIRGRASRSQNVVENLRVMGSRVIRKAHPITVTGC